MKTLEPTTRGYEPDTRLDSMAPYYLSGLSLVATIVLAIVASPALAVVAAVSFVLLLAAQRWLLDPQAIYFLALGAVFFFPANRYVLPIQLPMDLEPYRIAVGMAFAVWAVALLIDPRAAYDEAFSTTPSSSFSRR